ncbi:MAG TPA: nitrate- and nitrite sensing domain-containing protein [Streptosporangiaceae bacterium]|jgi:signal transduction histidine kinase
MRVRRVPPEPAGEPPAGAESGGRASPAAVSAFVAPGDASAAGPSSDGDQDGRAGESAPASPLPGKGSRRSLKNWRVRSRVLLLVAIPTLAALVLGGFRIVSSLQSAQVYQRVHQLALLGGDVTTLAQDLENERDQTAFYIALGSDDGRSDALSVPASQQTSVSPQLAVVQQKWAATNAVAATVRSLAGQIGGSYSAQTQASAAAVQQAIAPASLANLRAASTQTELPALVVVQKYAETIDAVLALNADIAQGAGDPQLAQTVSVLGLVSAMKEEASQQRALISAALIAGRFGPGQLTALQNAISAQQSNLQEFDVSATPDQLQLWNASVSRSDDSQTSSDELQAQTLAAQGSGSLSSDPTSAQDWYDSMSGTIQSQMGSVEHQLGQSVVDRAELLRKNAIISAAIIGAIVFLLLALATLLTVIVARSMVRPLRRLRADALRVAGVRLPEMVRRLSESDGDDARPDVEPIDVDSTDEIGEVARAFDQVHSEAVRLAANEARLRGNVNAMFINLSRRTQSLVERQIHLIDDLEQGEQDSERLGSLFRLDHLATRMRRNSENLLVLAGHEASRRWSQPVALVDVLRAAVSEIEQYERVSLNVQPGIAVRGQVVNDVVHLLAELVENATSFSSTEAQVNVSGHLLNSGGVLLDITDQGVGMAADEMAHANWRLDNPPVVDVAVSRRMGLFVVARLASRHGIRVRLRPAPSGGMTALIWLPDETITHEASGAPAGLRRFEVDTAAAPISGFVPADNDLIDDAGRSAAQEAVAAARVPRFTAFGARAEDERLDVPEQGAGDHDLDPVFGAPPAGRTGDVATAAPWDDLASADAVNGSGAADSAAPAYPVDDATAAYPAIDLGAGSGTGAGAGTGVLPSRDPGQSGGIGPASENGTAGIREDLEQRFGLSPRTGSRHADRESPADEVIVPPAMTAGEDNRLPIFESVESDWFRRGRHEASPAALDEVEPVSETAEIATGWSSPADDGWRAAEAVETPTAAGVTSAGLPKRVPQANLVPGGVAEPKGGYAPGPVRNAAATRQRMASFQRGAREGRAALRSDDESPGTESEETS